MSVLYPLSFHRRIERQWAERIKSLRRVHGQIVAAAELTLQRAFNNDGSLIPLPVRTVVDQRRRDQCRSRD
jgi:hypothetical protein